MYCKQYAVNYRDFLSLETTGLLYITLLSWNPVVFDYGVFQDTFMWYYVILKVQRNPHKANLWNVIFVIIDKQI